MEGSIDELLLGSEVDLLVFRWRGYFYNLVWHKGMIIVLFCLLGHGCHCRHHEGCNRHIRNGTRQLSLFAVRIAIVSVCVYVCICGKKVRVANVVHHCGHTMRDFDLRKLLVLLSRKRSSVTGCNDDNGQCQEK